MKAIDKLKALKETVTDSFEELGDVKDLSAEEYAAYYGGNYTNFYKAVKAKVFAEMAERENEGFNSETEELEEKPEYITVEMKVSSNKNGMLTFDEPKYLGQKETLDHKIIGFLLAKANMNAVLDTERNVLVIETRTVFDKLGEVKDDYMDKISEKLEGVGASIAEATAKVAATAKEKTVGVYEDSKTKASGVIKRSLKKASEWADKNL